MCYSGYSACNTLLGFQIRNKIFKSIKKKKKLVPEEDPAIEEA